MAQQTAGAVRSPVRDLNQWADRRMRGRGLRVIVLLVLFALACVAVIVLWPDVWPVSLLVVPLILAQSFLNPTELRRYIAFVFVLLVVAVLSHPDNTARMYARTLVVLTIGCLVAYLSMPRTRLGIAANQAESMFVDLLDRIQGHAALLPVPPGFHLETAIRAAGNTPFNGDFVVSSYVGDTFQIAVVDVSGKGTQAGTRALQLSGALAGFITALPPHRFLEAANTFLCSQDWAEGFATAIHVTVHVPTGAFEVRSAGHLPVIQLRSGSGRWAAVDAEGPALGLIPDVEYPATAGEFRHGDAVLLYTDGVVERPREPIDQGIDRLVGQAERELKGGFEGLAGRLVDATGSHDDRTLVLLHRR
jgi:hypothetical protein